ncbi:MAG: GIY-YIG nuclease family protein [Terriglobia bacterium]
MFTVYILQSERTGRYYVGQTSNLPKRLHYHQCGLTRSGRNRGPWRVVYQEEFSTRSEAVRRERQIKKWKSRRYLEKLMHGCEALAAETLQKKRDLSRMVGLGG